MVERFKGSRRNEREEHELAFTELEKAIKIDKNRLDDHLEQQADLKYRVAKELTMAISIRDGLKQEVAELEAQADEAVRLEAEQAKERLTETEAKMRARLWPELKGAQADFLAANRRVAEWQALKEAFTDRSYAMNNLVALYSAQYWDEGSAGRGHALRRDRDAAEARRGMHQARQERRRDRER